MNVILVSLILVNIGRGDSGLFSPPGGQGQSEIPKAFPIINIRFSYPPTSVDPRRTLALGQRQAAIVSATSRASATIEDDVKVLVRHLELQESILKYLMNLPTDLMTPIQKRYVKQFADSIPMSSFLERFNVSDTPQINIAVEDNRASFAVASEMTPAEGAKFVTALGRTWMANRRLLIELIKVNFKRIEILFDFLYGRMEKTAKTVAKLKPSFLQTDEAMLDLDDTEESARNATAFAINPAVMQSVEFPLIMALRARVLEGGRSAAKALAGLIDLWNEQKGSREAIRASMVMADCNALMMMKKTPDYVRNLAGTLMTLISGLPAWSAVTDPNTGSDAHVNIIVPRPSQMYRADKEVALGTGGD